MSRVEAPQQQLGGGRRRTGMERFAAETLSFVVQTSFAQAAAMHLFDEGSQRVWLGSRGIPEGFRSSYYNEGMWQIDPLASTRARGGKFPLTGLQSAEAAYDCSSVTRYRSFLSSFGILDTAEIVFIEGGEPIGGMSLMWTRDSNGSCARGGRVASLRRYLELGFTTAMDDTPIGWRKRLARDAGLTPREVQVVELVGSGHTNQEVAEELNVSVTTVKSHLLHIFQKMDVPNRAGLVQRVLTRPAR